MGLGSMGTSLGAMAKQISRCVARNGASRLDVYRQEASASKAVVFTGRTSTSVASVLAEASSVSF